jgi:Pyruvate/2-oxoacid:ferredoxin oxidoreductase delta subunit
VEACPNDALIIEEVKEIDEDKCVGCGLCELLCRREAIKIVEKENGKKATIDRNLCKGCGICAAACPRDAIKMNYFTDEEVKQCILSVIEAV